MAGLCLPLGRQNPRPRLARALGLLPFCFLPRPFCAFCFAAGTRTLYSKRHGHADWVVCVAHLSDGRIISGGADSKLCLWSSHGVSCQDLIGHTSSVSALARPLNHKHRHASWRLRTVLTQTRYEDAPRLLRLRANLGAAHGLRQEQSGPETARPGRGRPWAATWP